MSRERHQPPVWGIVFYKDPHGNVPAREFLDACGFAGPRIVLIDGGVKPNAALFADAYYEDIQRKGTAYRATTPRSIA